MFELRHLIIRLAIVLCVMSFSTAAKSIPISEHEEVFRRLYKAHRICEFVNIASPTSPDNDDTSTKQRAGAYVRCIASNMGLWTDAMGYNAKGVAKFFIKERNGNEVMTVVDYCNQKHQQADLDLWAYEAFSCATSGQMGVWLKEYVQSVKL